MAQVDVLGLLRLETGAGRVREERLAPRIDIIAWLI